MKVDRFQNIPVAIATVSFFAVAFIVKVWDMSNKSLKIILQNFKNCNIRFKNFLNTAWFTRFWYIC